MVELHAQAEADVAEMRTALLAVEDPVHALAAGATVRAEAGFASPHVVTSHSRRHRLRACHHALVFKI